MNGSVGVYALFLTSSKTYINVILLSGSPCFQFYFSFCHGLLFWRVDEFV